MGRPSNKSAIETPVLAAPGNAVMTPVKLKLPRALFSLRSLYFVLRKSMPVFMVCAPRMTEMWSTR